MLISVVIPTCNRNDLLSKCLDVLAPDVQKTAFEYEIIVTDDSKDGAAQLLITQHYSWAKWVEGPRRGPASNRNNGARNAKGEWIVFIDDDCVPDTDMLLSYADAIANNSDVEVIEGVIYSDEVIPLLYTAPVNLTGGYLWSCNFGIKAKAFFDIGCFDENYKYPNLEDNDLHKRLQQAGYKILFGSKVKVYHPIRPVASPKKYAMYHESWLYYHKKFNDEKTVRDLLLTIARNRVRTIMRSPKSFASVKALFLMIEELFFTWRNSKKWS